MLILDDIIYIYIYPFYQIRSLCWNVIKLDYCSRQTCSSTRPHYPHSELFFSLVLPATNTQSITLKRPWNPPLRYETYLFYCVMEDDQTGKQILLDIIEICFIQLDKFYRTFAIFSTSFHLHNIVLLPFHRKSMVINHMNARPFRPEEYMWVGLRK